MSGYRLISDEKCWLCKKPLDEKNVARYRDEGDSRKGQICNPAMVGSSPLCQTCADECDGIDWYELAQKAIGI